MPEPEHEDELFTCWCGETGVFEEMFDWYCVERGCGGSGIIRCICGGDFCCCHHHGEFECDGCQDCERDEDDFDDDDREYADWEFDQRARHDAGEF